MSTTFLPSYSVGPDAYEEIGFVTKFYGKTVAVVGGETALKKASPRLLPALEKAGLAVTWRSTGRTRRAQTWRKSARTPRWRRPT